MQIYHLRVFRKQIREKKKKRKQVHKQTKKKRKKRRYIKKYNKASKNINNKYKHKGQNNQFEHLDSWRIISAFHTLH